MSARSKRRSRSAAKRPRRWLELVLGILLFAGAFWLLLQWGDETQSGEIDAKSRAKLQRVLEKADREAGQ